jgi:hypothetical protein
MDNLHLFSSQCWQFVDLMRIPVKALRIVQFRSGPCRLGDNAAEVLRDSQQPLFRFLKLPWTGFTVRLARHHRARFNVYHRLVEDAFQCPEYLDLTILLDALDAWSIRIEDDSADIPFCEHGSAARMISLTARLDSSITESEVWSCLNELREDFRQLAETVTEMENDKLFNERQARSTLAALHLNLP